MEGKGLIAYEETTALAAFTSDEGLDPYIEQAKNIVEDFDHDLSTAAGRKKTASLAAKVATLKVKLDDLGKDLVSDWKTKAKAVDKNRKSMRDALDDLKIEARKPLTDWEDEQARIEEEEAHKKAAEELQRQVDNDHELAVLLDEKITAERAEEARQIEQDRIDRENEMKAVAAEEARIKAELAAKEENEKVEREKFEAEERAKESERQRIAAEERTKLEAEQAERNKEEAKIASDQAIIDAAQAAKEKAEKDQRDREAAELAAKEKREANTRNISKVRKQAKESIMALGFNEDDAKKIVLAIHNKDVANVIINY